MGYKQPATGVSEASALPLATLHVNDPSILAGVLMFRGGRQE